MTATASPATEVPGFIDSHTHLLKEAAQAPFPWAGTTVAGFHQATAQAGITPMDVPDAPPPGPPGALPGRLLDGLRRAAAAGLTEITEMGMRDWRYLDALDALQQAGPLPVRVRIYLASGLAEETHPAEADARRAAAAGPGRWVSLDGVKFYADGWLGPRTCAMEHGFADRGGTGILFLTAAELARRIAPLAARGWRIATHAIGDRGVATVLDAYDLAWNGDRAAIAAAAPRIEHASLQSAELISRLAASGVVACLQPSFAVTDVPDVGAGLDPARAATAYPWAALAAAGAPLLAGSDYPIEVLDPLPGLARLVAGRSERDGFRTTVAAPSHSRLTAAFAYTVMSDEASGRTLLSADPRTTAPGNIDQIQVLGTAPVPF
ncbi:MAG TPA: amidohydrolase family protein [Streptosporangiaceae bacterium]|nr:amidohydrolase family protein [Streptosporangiaceae bacterium]